MVDPKLVRENPEIYKKSVEIKGMDVNIDKFLKVDKNRSELLQKIEKMRHVRNEIDDKMRSASGAERPKIIEAAKQLKTDLQKCEPEFKELEIEYKDLLGRIPLPPAGDWPVGKDEADNEEISKQGEIPKFDFQIKDHIELGKSLGILDLESGVNISGFRGYVLKNEGVLLQMAVLWHALKKLREKGFELNIPPTIVKPEVLFGSGHFPFDTENIYRAVEQEHVDDKEEDEKFLSGTSEPSLLALNQNKTLSEKDLPIKLAGFSPCYRSEIGSYGKDTKGIYRIHEFWKVEQVVLCANDVAQSNKWLEDLRIISEEILQDFGLPYRIVKNCTGDMGAGKYKMYDIETWMPSRDGYGETHSDSALHDWQARRLNIKYKDSEGKTKFVHTLNNTAIATPRILIPLLENYQQADGSVKIPEVLQEYLGTDVIKLK